MINYFELAQSLTGSSELPESVAERLSVDVDVLLDELAQWIEYCNNCGTWDECSSMLTSDYWDECEEMEDGLCSFCR